MNQEKKNGFAEAFGKFCEMMTNSIKNVCTMITIIGSIGLLCFSALQLQANKPFETSDSRLEKQIYTILNEYIGTPSKDLTGQQREKLISALIAQYDPATDNLNPVTNPNAKPIDLAMILSKFNIESDKFVIKENQTNW